MSDMKSGLFLGTGLAVAGVIGLMVWYRQNKTEKDQRLLERCKAELKLYGDKFEGLYSATERFIQKKNSSQEAEDLCFRWKSRLENCEQTAGLWNMWMHYNDYEVKIRIEKWYDFLVMVGVKKCEEKEVLVDHIVLKKYDLPDGMGDCMGRRMQVEIPCWMLEEKVLEKGILV